MKNRYATVLALGVAAFAMLAVTLVPISAQLAGQGDAKAAPGGKGGGKGGKGKAKGDPTAHIGTLDFKGQPDFGGPGMWSNPYITNMSNGITAGGVEAPCPQYKIGTKNAKGEDQFTPSCAPFTALGKQVFAGRRITDSATDPEGFCLPPGVPRMMYTPYPMKIIQEPNMVTFIFEGGGHVWRQVPIGPKGSLKHEEDPNPTYLGDSYGWWEGDTLVIDSVGFNERTWLDFSGHPHGEKLHVIERFTRLDTLTLQHIATIEDPDYYTHPWSVTTNVSYQPNGKILEYICQENERDTKHLLEDLAKRGITRESVK